MKKAVWIISVLLTIIISMAYFYFRSSLNVSGTKDVFSFISSNNALVACLKYENDLKDIFESDENIPSLIYQEFVTESVWFESIIKQNSNLAKSVNGQEVYIACQKLNAKRNACVFLISLNAFDTDDPASIFNADDAVTLTAKARKFESENIYQYNQGGKEFYYVYKSPYLLFSKYPSLLEDCIRARSQSNGLSKHAIFQKWQEEQQKSKSLMSVFVNHAALNELYSVYFQNPLIKALSISEEFADFSYSEVNYKSDAWILNGEIEASESKYFHLLKTQTENRSYLSNYLSNNTWSFQNLILSDGILFRQELQNQQRLNQDYLYEAEQKLLNKKYFLDIKSFINEHIGEEFMIAYNANFSILKNTGSIGMLVLKQSAEFEQALAKIVKTPKAENYKGQVIKAFPFRKFMYLSAGIPFKEFESNFYTIFEDRLVLASTAQDLKKYIDDFQSEQLLKNNENFQNYISTLNDQYNYLFYTGIMGYENSLTPLFTEKGNLKLNDRLGWSNYSAFSYQVTSSDAGLISSTYMPMKADDAETSIEQKWSIDLDAQLSSPAQWISLNGKKEHYIVVQDDTNKVYLIDEGSNIKWKKQIGEKIISEIRVVDYYKNGESQLIFNTPNYIYLMDINGQLMPNYPIKLAATASKGMSLFDYEKDHNYRIFIPCINQCVYGYDISARPIEGWNPKRVGTVLDVVKHINVKGKDLIFIANSQGYFYFYNRKGEIQAQFKDSVGIEYKNPFFFDSNTEFNKNRFISTDQKGKIKSIFIDGRRLYKTVGNWTDKHYFLFANVMGDEQKDYVFIDNNQLMVYQDDTTLGFNYQFNTSINQAPFLFNINETESLVGVFSEETQQIYLFDRQGKLQNGFPLKASSSPTFLISNEQKKMVLGTKEGKIIYYVL
jgi:hypothetical protein